MADETDKPSKPWGEKKENGYMISYFKGNTEPTTEKINQKNEKITNEKMGLQRKEENGITEERSSMTTANGSLK